MRYTTVDHAMRSNADKTPKRPSATARRAGMAKRKAKRADQINIALLGQTW